MEAKKNKRYSVGEAREITLLTVEEAKRLPESALNTRNWWLRTPGTYDYRVAYVYHGKINTQGIDVCHGALAVRPAFKFQNLDANVGEKVFVGKTLCTVIEPGVAFADEHIDYYLYDKNSNNWDESLLKRYINSGSFKKRV